MTRHQLQPSLRPQELEVFEHRQMGLLKAGVGQPGPGARKRITCACRMLQAHDPPQCAVRGVSEWIDLDAQLRLLIAVHALGHEVAM